MQKKTSLSDIRNALESINKAIMAERGDGEAPTAEALERCKKLHPKEIKELSGQLIDIALTKLNNEVSNRKGPKVLTNEGFDLFGGYHGIPKMITLIKGKKKDVVKATFQEADLWLKSHDRPENDETVKNEEFKRLVADCLPYKMSEDDTLEIAMKRKIEAEGNGRLSL